MGAVPVAAAAGIAYLNASSALRNAQRTASDTMKKQMSQQLSAVRDEKRAAVEQYFQTINDQISTFSEDRMVVRAMRDFRKTFREYRAESALGADEIDRMRLELSEYYVDDFNGEYRSQNSGKSPQAEKFLSMLDIDSIALQHAYIRANQHPLGSKHELDRDSRQTAYNALHGEVHPVVRNYLDKFGYYDIFLCDPETGDIVYSVFKELDFSTSLIDGPYADTNFGEAFRRANAATAGEAVVLVDYAPYTPSYEAPASFIASPIFDGGEKIGVALFQMPLGPHHTSDERARWIGANG